MKERRVKFEAHIPSHMQDRDRHKQVKGDRGGNGNDMKRNTTEVDDNKRKKKQPIGFEEFLKGKPGRQSSRGLNRKEPVPKFSELVNRNKHQNEENRAATKPALPKKPNLKKDRSQNLPNAQNLETPPEESLENIFESKLDDQPAEQYQLPSQNYGDMHETASNQQSQPTNNFMVEHVSTHAEAQGSLQTSVRNAPEQENIRSSQVRQKNSGELGDSEAQAGKQIRGLFHKEIYGNDESKKKEAQTKMKKELELQMEQNKLKKEQERKKKEEEDKKEQEKYERYLEKEKMKKMEEERKELEAKRKKEEFAAQQAALLEEYQQQTNLDKRSKHSKKTAGTENPESISQKKNTSYTNMVDRNGVLVAGGNSIHAMRSPLETPYSDIATGGGFRAGDMMNPKIDTIKEEGRFNFNQAVSPPSITNETHNQFMPSHLDNSNVQAMLQNRQFTPMTNFSNNGKPFMTEDSIPVEKNVLETLLKENQGLKQEANRNNIILDFLTSRPL